jgi:hypothetical protein
MSSHPRADTEAWREDIVARVRAMDAMLTRAAIDLTLEQMNHVERPGVLPIAFSLIHVVGNQDRMVGRFLNGTPPVWKRADWTTKVGLVGEPPVRGTPMVAAERIRFGNADGWREYQAAVFAETERALQLTPAERFEREAFDGSRPASLAGGFLELLVPSGPIRIRAVVEAWIFQHGLRHLGEIEHARALVGLGGMS